MDAIPELLDGSMEMKEFLRRLKDDPSLGNAARKLISVEAIDAPEHPFWESQMPKPRRTRNGSGKRTRRSKPCFILEAIGVPDGYKARNGPVGSARR